MTGVFISANQRLPSVQGTQTGRGYDGNVGRRVSASDNKGSMHSFILNTHSMPTFSACFGNVLLLTHYHSHQRECRQYVLHVAIGGLRSLKECIWSMEECKKLNFASMGNLIYYVTSKKSALTLTDRICVLVKQKTEHDLTLMRHVLKISPCWGGGEMMALERLPT